MDFNRVEELLERWDDLHNEGRDVSADELCGDYPELLEEVSRRIAALKATAWLETPTGDHIPDPEIGESINLPKGLGRYRLDEPLGVGGFGQVWKAFDPDLERFVAIKIPRLERLSSPEQSERFMEEARKVAKLSHPGIVPVYDVGRENGYCYIVSEFIGGGSLADRMKQGRLDIPTSLRLVSQVADALQHAHHQGFIHRDVKPANILLDQDGTPSLADFGIAVSDDQSIGETSITAGTLAYMSPEQVEGTHSDARTDTYSLGVVLYELLTGRLPFAGDSPLNVRDAILEGQPKPPRTINDQVPKQVEAICLRAMARSPGDRYSTANDFADQLRAVLNAKPRIPWRVIIGGLLFVALLLFGRWLWNARQDAMAGTERIRQQVKTASQKARAVRSGFKPENAVREVELQRGHILFEKKRFEEALLAYTEAVRADPKSSEAFHRRGACRYNMEDYLNAIADFDQAIQLDPTNAEIYKNRSFANQRVGEYDRAISDAEQAVQLGSTSGKDHRSTVALAYSTRGKHYGNEKRTSEAISDFTKAIQYDPDDAALYDMRGSAFFNVRRFDEAIADFNQAVELDSTNASFREHRNFVFALQAKAKQEEADRETSKKRP